MYIVCTIKPSVDYDRKKALYDAIYWGSLSAPATHWLVRGTFPSRDDAVDYAKSLADRINETVEVRSCYGDGEHYQIGNFHPSVTEETTTTA